MFIESITLCNYRAYKGVNKTIFEKDSKNIFLISGENGFGKTTFLTSLVWCLYGKMMADVDDKFRKEILGAHGYQNYARQNLHKTLADDVEALNLSLETKREILKNGYYKATKKYQKLTQYYVEICLTDVFIPSIPCNKISIRRTFDYLFDNEITEVLIDGKENALAKEVGYDIFINDFILSKDIAKFFFFDAEKIVNLAEVKSLDEKRRLSMAYSEVLGIKKYEDIKRNLDNLRLKFRKNAGSSVSVSKLNKLEAIVVEKTNDIACLEQERENNTVQLDFLKAESEALQEKLIREGNAMSVDELNKKKELCEKLKEKDVAYKVKMKEMMDLAPFAISGNLLKELKAQADNEKEASATVANINAITKTLHEVHSDILTSLPFTELDADKQRSIHALLDEIFDKHSNKNLSKIDEDFKVLLDFTPNEYNEFCAIYDKLRYSYSVEFKQLVKDSKKNMQFLIKTQKEIAEAEHDDGNADIQTVRAKKAENDNLQRTLEAKVRQISEQIGVLNKDLMLAKKQLSETAKLIKLDKNDGQKDLLAERLSNELSAFLFELKSKRRLSLGNKIRNEINKLMHKTDFIFDVQVEIIDDIIEINLLDKDGAVIDKEKLSKGEQQLYATSILKALVDESGIDFPVFIDSPLQKFDSVHSANIVTKFYPTVSKQVVIFPLLGKELSEREYDLLLPHVKGSYIIKNDQGCSSFQNVEPTHLFETLA